MICFNRTRSGLSRLRLSPGATVRQWSRLSGLATPATAALAVVSAAVVLMLGGCASPGTLPEPLALRPAVSVGLDADPAAELRTVFPSAQWWRGQGDPALDGLVKRALVDPPSLAAAGAGLARAAAAAESTQAAQGPQGGLGLDLTRQRYTETGQYPPALAGGVHDSGNLQASASLDRD